MSLFPSFKCPNARKVEGLAFVAVLALVPGAEEHKLILSVIQSQAAVGFRTLGQGVKAGRSTGNQHCRG